MYAQIRSGLGLTVMALVLITSACNSDGVGPTPPPAPRVASVSVNPESLVLSVGESKQLQVSLFDSSGNPVTGVSIQWTASNQNVGVNSTGLVTAFAVGESEVKASAGGVSKTVKVTVAPPAPVFIFDDGISQDDRKNIPDAMTVANEYFKKVNGRGIEVPVTVIVYDSIGVYPVTSDQRSTIWIRAKNPGWQIFGRTGRMRMVIHEAQYLLRHQEMKDDFGAGTPAWMYYGSAEVVAYKALSDGGVLPYEKGRGCNVWNVAMSSVPLPTLQSTTEPKEVFYSTPGPVSSLAMLAVDELAGNDPKKIMEFFRGASGEDWKHRFKDVFGVTTDAFYQNFEASRIGWEVPSSYECH